MAIRLLSHIEPFSSPNDGPRSIAGFMSIVACIGALPGIYGLLMCAFAIVGTAASAEGGALFAATLLFAYIALGLRQGVFYLQRLTSSEVVDARKWWMSSFLYNLVPLALSVGMLIDEGDLLFFGAAAWFGALSTMCLVARGGEVSGRPPRHPRRA